MRSTVEAKLNLCLNVIGRCGDKHLLDGLFVPAGITDVIYAEKSDGISVEYTDGRTYERDNALIAALAVKNRYLIGGARFTVEKDIPEGAGLGGSSADAGAVCKILSDLYDIEVDDELMLGIGSDVPYFYRGGSARVRGTGEKCDPVSIPRLYKAIIVPEGKVNTAECYALYDKLGGESGDVDGFIEELSKGGLPKPFNALRRAAEVLNPRIADCVKIMEQAGFVCGMTGSGSAVFGLETDAEAYNYKLMKLTESTKGVRVYSEKE